MYLDACTLVAAAVILVVGGLLIAYGDELQPNQVSNLFRHRARRPYRPGRD